MLSVVVILKALAEIAGLALLGQGVLYLLTGADRDHNLFYRILKTLTAPIRTATRIITPRVVPDGAIGWASFFLVAGLWLALTIVKIRLVLAASTGAPG
jgi:hypothetical protein